MSAARALGVDRVLVTCDAENIGSRRITESNGGVLEGEFRQPGSRVIYRRYWIELDVGERG